MPRNRDHPVILIELMRFACALAVMAYHYGVAFWHLPGVHPAQLLAGLRYATPAEGVLQFGWLGVEIFFVISGMVIARSASCVTASDFVRRRVLRLVPAAWICATLTLAAVGGVSGLHPALWACWTRSVAFWPTGTPIDGSYWTLGIELAFYLAVTLAIAGKAGPRRREYLAVALGLASLLTWIWCATAGSAGVALMSARAAQLLLLKHGCFFSLGVLISRCQADGLTPLRLAAVGATLTGGGMEITVHAIQIANDTGLPRAIGTASALFAAAVALLAGAERAQEQMARWVRPEVARALGVTTYPLYLLHQDAGAALAALLYRRGLMLDWALMATGVAMLALSAWVARTAEPALRAWLAGTIMLRVLGEDRPRTASLPTG